MRHSIDHLPQFFSHVIFAQNSRCYQMTFFSYIPNLLDILLDKMLYMYNSLLIALLYLSLAEFLPSSKL